MHKFRIFIALLVLIAVGLACNLPKSSSTSNATQATQSGPVATQGQSNSTVDFGRAKIELSDLPEGFTQISETELARYGINLDSLLNSISTPLAKAKPENLTVFSKTDGFNTTFIVSFILQPLTLIERGAFDLLAKDPQKAAQLFQKAVPDFTFTPQTGVKTIGDSMLDITFTYSQATIPLQGDLVISKRKQVVSAVVEAGLLGSTPDVSAFDIAQIMDGKIADSLK